MILPFQVAMLFSNTRIVLILFLTSITALSYNYISLVGSTEDDMICLQTGFPHRLCWRRAGQ